MARWKYYDQGLRKVEKIEDFLEGAAGKASYCHLLIELSNALAGFAYAQDTGIVYYADFKERSKLPDILFPEFNEEKNQYGMDNAIAKAKSLLGERHPMTLEAKAGIEGVNYVELIQEQRKVLGFDHPMILETLYSRLGEQEDFWDQFFAFNDLVDVLEVNLDRLGVNHPSLLMIFNDLCLLFDDATTCFFADVAESRASDLLRMLSKPQWDNESCPASMEVLRLNLRRTVESVDANKIQVGSRVAVWSWQYQNYWSGEVKEVKEGGVFFVRYDLPGGCAWISPFRRHPLLLSHGSKDPAPLPLSTVDELQVGKRTLIWYGRGRGYDSFYSADIKSRDETQIEVMYDTGETQAIPLGELDGSRPFCVTTRNDVGSVDLVKVGDNLYVYWESHDTHWLGKVVAVTDGEEGKETPTRYQMQYYSGDVQVCDLSEMPFFSEAHPRFSY
mmetsp:Transcript_26300/g.64112  ORF Transcript_26300/g.64112 Transcript_26300/m.64112 type:complete len:445 (+) Transcript_26300:1906-3240(+)